MFKKKYINPYFQKKRKSLIKIPVYSWRVKIIILLIFIAIIGLTWFIFFTKIFYIKEITVKGAIKISVEEIKTFALEQTKANWSRGGNIFLFSKNDLIKKINEKYNLDNLLIEKRLPDKLIISFKEKQQSIVWFEADKYYYADTIGNIINEVDPLNISQEDIPLINNNGHIKIIDKKIEISQNKIKFISNLFFEFKEKKHNFEIEKFVVNNEENTVGLKIIGGPIIYFNTEDNLSKQIGKLTALISQKLKDDFIKKSYIDLRYGDKVYYR
ncbi:MAG: hypothetical protein V1649_03895 [Patescibacteria group bacterium]